MFIHSHIYACGLIILPSARDAPRSAWISYEKGIAFKFMAMKSTTQRVILKKLCSKLHRQNVFYLIPFSYKILSPVRGARRCACIWRLSFNLTQRID